MVRSTLVSAAILVFLVGCEPTSVELVHNDPLPDAPQNAPTQDNSPEDDRNLGDLEIGQPITAENLTVFPIITDKPQMQDQYITLDEGLAAGTVEVREGGDDDESDKEDEQAGSVDVQDDSIGGTDESVNGSEPITGDPLATTIQIDAVNPTAEASAANDSFDALLELVDDVEMDPFGGQEDAVEDSESNGQSVGQLFVRNDDDKPLYLMSGELALGGDQDRMFAEASIVPPGSKAFAVKVFCVEQGRWATRNQDRTVADLAVASSLNSSADLSADENGTIAAYPANLSLLVSQAQDIKRGKFVGGLGTATNAVRKAAQVDKDQQQVWNKVAIENNKGKVETNSNAFTANYCQQENVKRLEPYLCSLNGSVSKTENVVGAIVVINGKIESLDVFNSTPLFRKLWPKLLKGFALQAANNSEVDVETSVSAADVREFLAKSLNSKVAENDETASVVIERSETDGVVCITSRTKQVADAADRTGAGFGGRGGGGFGGAVHSSAFPTPSK